MTINYIDFKKIGYLFFYSKLIKKAIDIFLFIILFYFIFSNEIAVAAVIDLSESKEEQIFSLDYIQSIPSEDLESTKNLLEKSESLKNSQEKVRDYVTKGLDYLRNGNKSEALVELNKAWQVNLNLVLVGELIAKVQLLDQKFENVLDSAKKIQEVIPNQPQGYILEGIAYQGLNDQERSKAAYSRAIELDPGNPAAFSNLAVYEITQGNLNQAQDYLREILKYNPRHLRTQLLLAKIQFKSGNTEQAIANLKEAMEMHSEALLPRVLLAKLYLVQGEVTKALRITEPTLKLYPNNSMLQELVGFARIESGNPSQAISPLESVILKYPKRIEAHYNLARAYEQLEQFDRSIHHIKKILEISPSHAPSQLLFARLLTQQGKLQDALGILKKQLEIYPDNPEINELAGRIALAQNRPVDAIPLYKKALKGRPNSVLTVQLAVAHKRAGDIKIANSILYDWLKKYPSDLVVMGALANLLIVQNKFDEAREQYEKLVVIKPDLAGARNNLAWLLIQKGEFDKALIHANKAFELAPENPQVLDTLGLIFLKKDQYKKAIKLFQMGIEKDPKNKSTRFHMAQALVQIKKFNESKRLLNKILADDRQFPERNEAIALLKKIETK